MTRRKLIFIGLIGALVAINLWRWWPESAQRPRMAARARGGESFMPQDFALRIASSERAGGKDRNLFAPKIAAAPKPKLVKGPPPPPPKTPEQLEEEAARVELSQYKLLGVVFRGTKGQAYLVRGDQNYLVSAGDKVGDRFAVEAISADAVELKDPRTNVGGRIPVSGK